MIELSHRITLTELCNRSCDHCFNSDFRKTGVMDADILIRFIRENSQHLSQTNLRLMGGEPTLHPRFYEVVEEGCKYYRHVNIFTNGSTMPKIAKDKMMAGNHRIKKVLYLINGHTFEIDSFDEYKEYIDFVTLFCVIPKTNVELFIEKVIQYSALGPSVMIILSSDTQANLFDDTVMENYRKDWMKAITEIVPVLRERKILFDFEHYFPICFFTQGMIEELRRNNLEDLRLRITCCGETSLGLIDYNFDIYHCNQTRIKLGSMLDDNSNPKSLEEVTAMLQNGPRLKLESIRKISDKCRGCGALPNCKVGCHYNVLKRETHITNG